MMVVFIVRHIIHYVMCWTNCVLYFKIHSCLYVIPKSIYFSYRLVFVNAQHNADLYIKLRVLKGQFAQQITIAEENNIVEPRVFRVKAKISKV